MVVVPLVNRVALMVCALVDGETVSGLMFMPPTLTVGVDVFGRLLWFAVFLDAPGCLDHAGAEVIIRVET